MTSDGPVLFPKVIAEKLKNSCGPRLGLLDNAPLYRVTKASARKRMGWGWRILHPFRAPTYREVRNRI